MIEPGNERSRLPGFVLVSGTGWLIDFSIFSTLASLGTPPFLANMVSAGTAVLFVFIVCRRALFRNSPRSFRTAIALYIVWNIVAITAASMLVQLIGRLIAPGLGAALNYALALGYRNVIAPAALAPIVAKIIVTPFTLYANFVAMNYINLCRLRLL